MEQISSDFDVSFAAANRRLVALLFARVGDLKDQRIQSVEGNTQFPAFKVAKRAATCRAAKN